LRQGVKLTDKNVITSYSLRVLCPFSGTARIIQQQNIRAISNNGVNWRIQIQTNSENLDHYTLFGLWTKKEGLHKFPVHHLQASSQQLNSANIFLERWSGNIDNLSFPLRDTMECWLLDQQQQPLALLNAQPVGKALPHVQPTWLPCAQGDHTFASSYLQQQSQQYGNSSEPEYHRDLVALQIHQTASQNREIQWFHRQDDGSGVGQSDYLAHATLAGRQLSKDNFPHYLLRQYWDCDAEQRLIDDFFHWQSPWLLCLPDISDVERRLLEAQACTYPQRLHALHHLYPMLLQKDFMTKILIQARLESASPSMPD